MSPKVLFHPSGIEDEAEEGQREQRGLRLQGLWEDMRGSRCVAVDQCRINWESWAEEGGVNAGAEEGKGDEGIQRQSVGTGRQWVAEEVAMGVGKPLARGVLVLDTGAKSPKKGDLALAYPVLSEPRGAAGGAGPICCHPIGGGSWGC